MALNKKRQAVVDLLAIVADKVEWTVTNTGGKVRGYQRRGGVHASVCPLCALEYELGYHDAARLTPEAPRLGMTVDQVTAFIRAVDSKPTGVYGRRLTPTMCEYRAAVLQALGLSEPA